MKKTTALLMIIGFLAVDFLFFHDIFKSGESITIAQYLTGLLSIPVLVLAAQSLLKPNQKKH
jgi:hypothetical protein